MFEETVKNKDGVTKRVIAGSKEELRDAVAAVKEEQSVATPDIDNPDHGNMTTAEFAENNGERTKFDAEAVPTSDRSKEVSRALAEVPRSERPEALAEATKDQVVSETVQADELGVQNTNQANKARHADSVKTTDDKKVVDNSKKS